MGDARTCSSSALHILNQRLCRAFLPQIQRANDNLDPCDLPAPLEDLLRSTLLDKYEFSIQEQPARALAGVITPAHLGIAYEFLMSAADQGQRGTFFTPPAEIDFICRQSLFYWLKTRTGMASSQLVEFLYDAPHDCSFSKEECRQVEQLLEDVQVLDPACGAGSFLVEMAAILLQLLQLLARAQNRSLNTAQALEHIVTNQIHGWDIKSEALEVAEIRLHLLGVASQLEDPLQAEQGTVARASSHLTQCDAILSPPNADGEQCFDIILGNPPYVRQRDIASPEQNEEAANLRYRQAILDRVQELHGDAIHFDAVSDYYLYFYLTTFPRLSPGGIHAFVTSNSWLDVNFGFPFQAYLCTDLQLLALVDSRRRTFEQAQINTVISFVQRPVLAVDAEQLVKFITFKDTIEGVATAGNMMVANTAEHGVEDHPALQVRLIPQQQLYQLGMDEAGQYRGTRWGNLFLRAPAHFFDLFLRIASQHGQRFLRVSDVARITRGFSTSCNDFFLLEQVTPGTFRNGYGQEYPLEPEFLFPVLRSPSKVTQPVVHAADVATFILLTDRPKAQLTGTTLAQYITDGEQLHIPVKRGAQQGRSLTGVQNLASFRRKPGDRWYAKKGFQKWRTTLFFQKIYNTTYKVGKVDMPIFLNNTFYGVYLTPEYQAYEDFLFASFQSSLTILSIELLGRSNFGAGALDTAKNDIEDVWVLNPLRFSTEQRQHLVDLACPLCNRPYLPLGEELQSPDRQALDEYVLELCGFDDISPADLYADILQATRARMAKARSFATKRQD
jgi:hypothetical protein